MPFSSQLADAARSVIRNGSHPSVQSDTEVDDVTEDTSFEGDGFAGSEVIAINLKLRGAQDLRIVAKRWAPFEWLKELSGLNRWAELLLHEESDLERIASASAVRVPYIGSCRTEEGDWILMEDVSEQLQTWRNATEDEPRYFWRPTAASLDLYAGLVDRIAHMHAIVDQSRERLLPERIVGELKSQERCVRGAEKLLQEWFGDSGVVGTSTGAPEVPTEQGATPWTSRTTIAVDRRMHFVDFLDRLSANDRSLWLQNMMNRDSLAAIARRLPRTLIHGDLNRRNIGIDVVRSDREYVLIDWEAAAYANHAFDLAGVVGGKVFSAEERGMLERHYLDRYRHHGGVALDDATWRQSVDLASAVEALDRLPHNGEIVRGSGSTEYIDRIEARTDRVIRYLRALPAA